MRLPNYFKSVLAVLFLLSFVLLSKYEDRAVVRQMDFATTVKVQDKIDKSAHLRLAAFVDNIMEGSSFFAGPEFTTIIVLMLTGVAFRKKKWRAFLIPGAFILLTLIEVYGKTVVHHSSPPFGMIKHTTSVFPANYINEQFSYPSGHTARAVFIAILSWFLFRRKIWLGVLLGGYVLLVSISRIYLGHHWLSDIVGGGLVGISLGLLTGVLLFPYNTKVMSA